MWSCAIWSLTTWPNALPSLTIATERLHQHRDTGLVLHHQLQHHLVEVRPMIPTIALGDVHDLFVRSLSAVITAIDMKARAYRDGVKRGRQAQTLWPR